MSGFLYLARRRGREAAQEWEEGERLGAAPPPYSWCRVAFSVTMVPPKTGQVFSIEQGPRTRRVVMYAPRAVVVSLTLAGLGSVPWVRDLFLWCVTHWK